MDTHELASKLREILSPSDISDDILFRRRPCIAVGRAQYGAPSSVIIEFEGTPGLAPIIVSRLGYSWFSRDVFVNGRKVGHGRRKQRLCKLVDRYLHENVPTNLPDDFDATSPTMP